MTEQPGRIDGIYRDLQERAKELNCLYQVEELAARPDLPLEQIIEGALAAIPGGWQFPAACRARISCEGRSYDSPGFRETPWLQSAPITVQGKEAGAVTVCYVEEMPAADEGPFLKEERRLIDTIAERLAGCVMHRRLVDEVQQRSAEPGEPSTREWAVILDLLRRTDRGLLIRVARKMLNHLGWSGVHEADRVLKRIRNVAMGDIELLLDTNEPHALPELPANDEFVDETFEIAARNLSDAEIVGSIHRWLKQDRAAFLVDAVESSRATLAEVMEAIKRYLQAEPGEIELSPPTMTGLKVTLVRRFLTSELEYINVSKNYLEIADLHEMMQRTVFPIQGHGKLGGKAAGLFLAERILRRHAADPLLAEVRTPRSWYLTSDVLFDFLNVNHFEDVYTHKYKQIDEIRQEYPDIIQVFKHSQFPPETVKALWNVLDEFGEVPLIVRSSSLLEDRFRAAFSGKYKSLFIANQGDKQSRLRALLDAIAEVYASTFGPDPIEYRTERNLLDFHEGMAIMIQEVVGTRVGDYYLPAYAGVAFSHNDFRWSARIRREDGLVRLVPGLGTRAVDRLGDDYPVLISPGQPDLRVNVSVEESVRYSPRFIDVLNLKSRRFQTLPLAEFLRDHGASIPGVERLVSVLSEGHLRSPMRGQLRFDRDDLVMTGAGLLTQTPFIKQVRSILDVLQREMGTPVDIEFASDGKNLYLLQCRAQSAGRLGTPAPIPPEIPEEMIVFSANRYVGNGVVPGISYIVYVDPEQYGEIETLERLHAVGRAVGRLNKVLPKRRFVLMGPGRWGSRGDIKLGVRVGYSDINNTAMLIEIARQKNGYTPEVSFGTHFFQDLVEASIRYLALYPDEPGVHFNDAFLTRSANLLPELAPEFAAIQDVVRVIDVPRETDGHVMCVLMNGDLGQAYGLLTTPEKAGAPADEEQVVSEPTRWQYWRWRSHMAERLAASIDPRRFGVVGVYLFGSTEGGSAGPGSDIDLLVHVRGAPAQREALERWLEGWSRSLAEMNFLRTGYRSDGLLDVHFITDDDIARKDSYAQKIGAVTDAARPLPLGSPDVCGT